MLEATTDTQLSCGTVRSHRKGSLSLSKVFVSRHVYIVHKTNDGAIKVALILVALFKRVFEQIKDGDWTAKSDCAAQIIHSKWNARVSSLHVHCAMNHFQPRPYAQRLPVALKDKFLRFFGTVLTETFCRQHRKPRNHEQLLGELGVSNLLAVKSPESASNTESFKRSLDAVAFIREMFLKKSRVVMYVINS